MIVRGKTILADVGAAQVSHVAGVERQLSRGGSSESEGSQGRTEGRGRCRDQTIFALRSRLSLYVWRSDKSACEEVQAF